MDYIYSRKRIKFPKIVIYKENKRKINKLNIILIFFIILVNINLLVIKAISPVFNKLCEDKAKGVAILICNTNTSECIKQYNYSDFIIIHMDDDKNIRMLEANMKNINLVISNITEKIQKEINNSQNEELYISSGSFTGVSLLSGRGPKIPIKISTIGNVNTELKSEFFSKGVNQTIHRLYLKINCEISILTPFNTINEEINNQFIIAENIIVGNLPQTYYDLEGLSENDAMEIMQ